MPGIFRNLALIFLFLLTPPVWADSMPKSDPEERTPTETIQNLEEKFDSYYTGDNLTPEQKRYNEDLKAEILRETFDIRELSRLALNQHWNERTTEEQDYFVDLMTRLLEKRAIFAREHARKNKHKSYQTRYLGDTYLNSERTLALTKTYNRIPKKKLDLDINYKMKKGNPSWKIFDVIVDDASLLENYKFQFDRIITKNGYADLIQRMERKYRTLLGQNE